MKQAYVDTNILLRFITGAPREQAMQARALFAAAECEEVILLLDEITVAETVWVLSSFYKFKKREIAQVLVPILGNEMLKLPDRRGMLVALTLFAEQNVDFVDALLSVHMDRAGVPDLVSYDKDFDRLPGVRRHTPEAFLAAT